MANKLYRVLPEFYADWGIYNSDEAIVDMEQIRWLSDEWEEPVEKLMEQVEDAKAVKYGIHYDSDDYCDVFKYDRRSKNSVREEMRDLAIEYTYTYMSDGYGVSEKEEDENYVCLVFEKDGEYGFYIFLEVVSNDGSGWMDSSGEYI